MSIMNLFSSKNPYHYRAIKEQVRLAGGVGNGGTSVLNQFNLSENDLEELVSEEEKRFAFPSEADAKKARAAAEEAARVALAAETKARHAVQRARDIITQSGRIEHQLEYLRSRLSGFKQMEAVSRKLIAESLAVCGEGSIAQYGVHALQQIRASAEELAHEREIVTVIPEAIQALESELTKLSAELKALT